MGREDGRERQEEGGTAEQHGLGPNLAQHPGGAIGGFGQNFHQLSIFLKCGGLVAMVAHELFSNYLTHPLFRSVDLFRAPAGFCWTVR